MRSFELLSYMIDHGGSLIFDFPMNFIGLLAI